MTLKKTKALAEEFCYCIKTMQTILKDMARPDSDYRFDVVKPTKRGDAYRASSEAVRNYLMGRKYGQT